MSSGTSAQKTSTTIDTCAVLDCSNTCSDLCVDFACCDTTTTAGTTTTISCSTCDCSADPCDMSAACWECCGKPTQKSGCMNPSDCAYDADATCSMPSACCIDPETGTVNWTGAEISACCTKPDGSCGGVSGCCNPNYCDRDAIDQNGTSAEDSAGDVDCCSDLYCNDNDRYRCVDPSACNYAMAHSMMMLPQYPNWWCVRASPPVCDYSCITTSPPTTTGPTTTTTSGPTTSTTKIGWSLICGQTADDAYCLRRVNAGQFNDESLCEAELGLATIGESLTGYNCNYTTTTAGTSTTTTGGTSTTTTTGGTSTTTTLDLCEDCDINNNCGSTTDSEGNLIFTAKQLSCNQNGCCS